MISALERYVARPVQRLLLPVAAAAFFGYAPSTYAMDSTLEKDLYTLQLELDALGNNSTEDVSRFLTPAKRQFTLDTYAKCVRSNEFGHARELAERSVRALIVNKRLSEEDKQGYLPLVSSLYVKLGMRPFGAGTSINQATEQHMIAQINMAISNYTRANRCKDRPTIMGNLLEGLADKAAKYDNNPSLCYILLTYGSYRGAKQSNEARALLSAAQRGCTNEYGAAIQLIRSLPQFRSASLAGQHSRVIQTADAILTTFDDKKFPSWPFSDLREEARLRKAYSLHLQKNIKDALAVAENCQLEYPGWDSDPVAQANQSANPAATYCTAERAFLTNPLQLSALGGMIDGSEGTQRDGLIALLNAIQPDGEVAQRYKAGKPDAGMTINGALGKNNIDKKDTPADNKQQPEENE